MIEDVNPFVYSRPVPPEDVVDRDEEVQALLASAVGGHYVRLYAPRKYGKTSLLTRVLRDGERNEGLIGVLVDLYRVSSIADVTVRLERAYARHLRGDLRGRVEAFLQRTGVGLSLGAFGISARLQLDPLRDPLPALHALLDLPLRLEASGGTGRSSCSTSSRTSAGSTVSTASCAAISSTRARSPPTSSRDRSRG